MDFFKLFDSYSVQARVYPALLTLLPGIATTLAWFQGLVTSNIGAALLTAINASGLLFLLAEFTRSSGRTAERKLLVEWGSMPTTCMLRHRDTLLPATVKGRYHAYLSTKIGTPLPTAAEEQVDPTDADHRYGSAVAWLREQCRGDGYKLLLSENTSYGFRRNLYGLKPVGTTISLFGIVWIVGALVGHYPSDAEPSLVGIQGALRRLEPVQVSAALLSFISLSAWLWLVKPRWVREAGDNYGVRLLAACDSL